MLEGFGGEQLSILDGTNFKLIRSFPALGIEQKTWSNTDNNASYGINEPTSMDNAALWQWVRLDTSSGAVRPMHTFSDFSQVSYESYEGDWSKDGQYVALKARKADGTTFCARGIPSSRRPLGRSNRSLARMDCVRARA